jgi:hypothetical protein
MTIMLMYDNCDTAQSRRETVASHVLVSRESCVMADAVSSRPSSAAASAALRAAVACETCTWRPDRDRKNLYLTSEQQSSWIAVITVSVTQLVRRCGVELNER